MSLLLLLLLPLPPFSDFSPIPLLLLPPLSQDDFDVLLLLFVLLIRLLVMRPSVRQSLA